VCNPGTRRITASVHVKFQESVPGFGTAHDVDSWIDVFFDADDGPDTSDRVPPPAELSHDDMVPIHTSLDSVRPTRVRVVPTHFEDYVAHVSIVPRICVTDSCESDLPV
jgi:hypothetical protein